MNFVQKRKKIICIYIYIGASLKVVPIFIFPKKNTRQFGVFALFNNSQFFFFHQIFLNIVKYHILQ